MLHRLLPLAFLGMGIFVLVQVVMPFASYKLWEMVIYQQNTPLVSPDLGDGSVLGVSVKNSENFPAIVSNNYRKGPPPYREFYLTIPTINLDNIKVVVESNNFDQNLAQMPGTALPGEKGNVFITGHSSLPILYDPKNFKTIFTHLPEVKKGDQIIVEANGQYFNYEVQSLRIVDPKDVWVIKPPDNEGRYLTLMTCVPPGLYIKRLIVLAKLQ
ncbi:MAG: class E sortase [Patescibacteria group bacterium]|nr:class E sortase [Patescibacteria group bacterium]